MRICIIKGSPRQNGNTNTLLQYFIRELTRAGHVVAETDLRDKEIHGCTACRKCQEDWSDFGCIFQDDAVPIFREVMRSEMIVLAAPIYSWYCPAPMKALLDRFVYGFNKYYGEAKGPSLWQGKRMALFVTCGYPPEKGADLFEEGMRRYCRHSKLLYAGMLAVHDEGYDVRFLTEEKIRQAVHFAEEINQGGELS